MIRAPLRKVSLAPGQRLTAAAKVARANRRSFTPSRWRVPTVDAVGVVRHEPYSGLIQLIERRPILPARTRQVPIGGDDRGSASKSLHSPCRRDCRRVYCVPVVVRVIGKNRIMIYGPKDDGTYVVEFKTAEGACWRSQCREPRRMSSGISRSECPTTCSPTARWSAASCCRQPRRRIAPGCGRAATTATSPRGGLPLRSSLCEELHIRSVAPSVACAWRYSMSTEYGRNPVPFRNGRAPHHCVPRCC